MEHHQRRVLQRHGLVAYGAVIALCAVLAGLTAHQHRVWRSNLTLWSHAVRVSPSLARPAINLAVAYRIAGYPEIAAHWLDIAGPLTVGTAREADYRRVLAHELGLLETFGTFVCDSPTARPYC